MESISMHTSNGFVGRNLVFRSIQFERYRKPCVVSYPRHAVVLNPHHTRGLHGIAGPKGERDSLTSSSNSNGVNVQGDNSPDNDDDDDPMKIDEELMLCRPEQLRQIIHLQWRNVGPNGCGLQNLANTCFANSVLQAIAYTPPIAEYFSSTFKTPCSHMVGAAYDYAYALGETVRKVHASSKGAYRPGLIISNMKSLSPHFRLGRQCDAHEFLVQLLNACHKSIMFRQVGSRKVAPRIERTNALQHIIGGYLRSVVAWSRQEEIQRLKKAGKMQEATDLQMCHHNGSDDVLVSNTYDPFVTLNVELAGPTLEHCLERLCEKEQLEGTAYTTPRGVGVRATKRFQLHQLPYVLIIHLKRFNCTGGKLSRFVKYPKFLNVAPFCTTEGSLRTMHSPSCNGGDSDNLRCLYELNAICVHDGNSLNYGHYYSVVRARNGTWLLCDDACVSHCSEERALGQRAYMLFYTRMGQPPRPSSSSNAAPARKEDMTIFQEHAKGRMTALASMPKPMDDAVEEDIGCMLTDEDVTRIIKANKITGTRESNAANGTDELQNNQLNGHCKGVPSEDMQEKNEDLCDKRDPFSVDVASENNKVVVSRNGSLDLMYNGIVKAMSRLRKPAETMADPEARVGEGVVGQQVVAVVQQQQENAMPTSIMRPRHAPKFRQRVRDPMWESEMDRGRVKRVREKHEEYSGVNRFQKAGVVFDSRGRRRTE